MRNYLRYLLPVLFILLGGCGYHLSGTSTFSPAVAGKKIAIPIFVNKSYRSNVGAVVTVSLVDEFARRTGGKVVSEAAADLLLTGTVVNYATSAVSYTAQDKVKEYRAVLLVAAALAERQTGKVIWKGDVSFGQDYPVNPDIALQQNSEDAAIREISRKIAQQIYQNISEGF